MLFQGDANSARPLRAPARSAGKTDGSTNRNIPSSRSDAFRFPAQESTCGKDFAAAGVPPRAPLTMVRQSLDSWCPQFNWLRLRTICQDRPSSFVAASYAWVRFRLNRIGQERGNATHGSGFFKAMFWGSCGFLWLLLGLSVLTSSTIWDYLTAPLTALLLAWLTAGFWTAVVGFISPRSLPQPRNHLSEPTQATRNTLGRLSALATEEHRTALVAPICNEPSELVFARLRAVCESVVATHCIERFELFVLSDTTDPHVAVGELKAWSRLKADLGGELPMYYRRRDHRWGFKAGNVADFCRDWGGRYRYMVVVDADSILSGRALVDMVRAMEESPHLGLIQSVPSIANGRSLLARLQQFASFAYGPMYGTGLAFWQGDAGTYWGHNAIIRVAPFAECCGLPTLRGHRSSTEEITSHDTVEAALLRRGGWGVRIDPSIQESYEETPSTTWEYARRERRWCQGNLQHLQLLGALSLHVTSRITLLAGILAYVASPLWLLTIFSTFGRAVVEGREGSQSLSQLAMPNLAFNPSTLVLLAAASCLLVPRLLGILSLLSHSHRSQCCGGRAKAVISVVLELLYSALLAPSAMLRHTEHIVAFACGRRVGWKSEPGSESDEPSGFKAAVSLHWRQTLLGFLGTLVVYLRPETMSVWLLPVLIGLSLSIPLTLLVDSVTLGDRAAGLGLLLTPGDTEPPTVLRRFRELA
jgi:membrane glycosyltransferase